MGDWWPAYHVRNNSRRSPHLPPCHKAEIGYQRSLSSFNCLFVRNHEEIPLLSYISSWVLSTFFSWYLDNSEHKYIDWERQINMIIIYDYTGAWTWPSTYFGNDALSVYDSCCRGLYAGDTIVFNSVLYVNKWTVPVWKLCVCLHSRSWHVRAHQGVEWPFYLVILYCTSFLLIR